MVTRRIVLGAGVAIAWMASTASFGACGPTGRRRRQAQAIDALLIDDSTGIPRQTAALIKASGWRLPVVEIQLDAAAQPGLRRVLDTSHAIVGISSGATLFCLERIAWDHGLRLTGRTQRCASNPGDDAWWQDVAAVVSAAHAPAANPSLLARAYRPSRADGMLHAWVMQKSASPQLRQRRLEV
jgi:hypothetical protein